VKEVSSTKNESEPKVTSKTLRSLLTKE